MREMSRRQALAAFGAVAAGAAGVAAVAAGGPSALAAGGRLRWRVRTGSVTDGVQNLVTGNGTAGRLVYAASGEAGTWAIDAATGKVAWRTNGPVAYSAGPGAAFGFDVTRGITDVVALSSASGRTLWSHDAGKMLGNATAGWLTYAGGLVYVAAGSTEFPTGIEPAVRALSAQTGERVWGADLTASSQQPVVAGGVVYACTPSRVVALNGATGARLWESPSLGDPGALLTPGGVICGDAVTASLDVETFALNAATGKLLWRDDLSGFPVAAADGYVFLIDSAIAGGAVQTTVWARHAQSGKLAWTRTFPEGLVRTAGDVPYICGGDGTLLAIAATTGHTLWSYRLGASVGDVAAGNGVVYAADAGSNVYALQD
jgi:outer membrane protein assembly factor BamB